MLGKISDIRQRISKMEVSKSSHLHKPCKGEVKHRKIEKKAKKKRQLTHMHNELS